VPTRVSQLHLTAIPLGPSSEVTNNKVAKRPQHENFAFGKPRSKTKPERCPDGCSVTSTRSCAWERARYWMLTTLEWSPSKTRPNRRIAPIDPGFQRNATSMALGRGAQHCARHYFDSVRSLHCHYDHAAVLAHTAVSKAATKSSQVFRYAY
jgi:hypothetical protein